MILVRDGLHIVPWQCAFVNRTPLLASLSIFGVCVSGCPSMHPIQSFRSSTAISRTFGLLAHKYTVDAASGNDAEKDPTATGLFEEGDLYVYGSLDFPTKAGDISLSAVKSN